MKVKTSGPTTRQLLHGSDTPTDSSRHLTAGPVTAQLDGADIRNIRLGDVELVQRIYLAVRDDVWNTVPAKLSNVTVEANADSFEVTFTAHHAYGEIDFTWNGRITGASDARSLSCWMSASNPISSRCSTSPRICPSADLPAP